MVIVPWWQVTQVCSFLHVTASFSRNARPRSIAFCAAGWASSPQAGLAATAKNEKAATSSGSLPPSSVIDVLQTSLPSLVRKQPSFPLPLIA